MAKKKFICAYCGGDVYRYQCQRDRAVRVFCDANCKALWQSENWRGENSPSCGTNLNLKGEKNPNYKHGKNCTPSFCHCGNPKDFRSSQCSKCAKVSFPKDGASGPGKTDEEIRDAVKNSSSFLETALSLDISRQRATRRAKELNLDYSHFRPGRGRFIKEDELLKKGKARRNSTVRSLLLRKELLEYKCIKCGIGPAWCGKELTLQLHHINGDSTDNRLENLQFLCPNCHTQTETFTGKNVGREEV